MLFVVRVTGCERRTSFYHSERGPARNLHDATKVETLEQAESIASEYAHLFKHCDFHVLQVAERITYHVVRPVVQSIHDDELQLTEPKRRY